ncbi:uncharacterized protein LOC119171335 isoform X1 [Rhipicephalus microplus]|uniref:uncharacterized protein LOC119171335 isoform X1 n=1 Tax=Rhipicephalus microplus TaxID=6941 RepID=UPI003F6D094C
MAWLSFLPTWIFVASIACTAVSKGEQDGDPEEGKCTRAFPLPRLQKQNSYRVKCRYLCRGWPRRFQAEPDGITCGVFGGFSNRRYCSGGKCVRRKSVQGTTTDGGLPGISSTTSTRTPPQIDTSGETNNNAGLSPTTQMPPEVDTIDETNNYSGTSPTTSTLTPPRIDTSGDTNNNAGTSPTIGTPPQVDTIDETNNSSSTLP